MPTYEYRCAKCGHELEAVQSFSEPALTQCPQCGEAALRKLFGNVGVVFKGSGFYRNDSRNEGKGGGKSAGAAPAKTGETTTTPAADGGAKATPTPAATSTPSASPAGPKPAPKTTSD